MHLVGITKSLGTTTKEIQNLQKAKEYHLGGFWVKSFAIEANICKRWKSKIPGLAVFATVWARTKYLHTRGKAVEIIPVAWSHCIEGEGVVVNVQGL